METNRDSYVIIQCSSEDVGPIREAIHSLELGEADIPLHSDRTAWYLPPDMYRTVDGLFNTAMANARPRRRCHVNDGC